MLLSVASQVAQLALPLDLNATDALRHHGLVERMNNGWEREHSLVRV